MSDSKSKRKKAYYVQASKAKRHRPSYHLDVDMKGFLITCNNAEKNAVREAYNVFNEYADKMYGPEQILPSEKNDETEEDEDFESAIQEEVQAIKSRDISMRRFQVVETKTNNCIFIRTALEHPNDLVTQLFTDLYNSQKSKSRFILKLYPVLGTCRATEDKIEKLAEQVLPPFLTGPNLTYCIIYKVRCNNTLGRDVILQLMTRTALGLNPSIKVKFEDPDLVISVDVLQKICCLSVLKNYNRFRKYNLQEVVAKKSDVHDAEAANLTPHAQDAQAVNLAPHAQDAEAVNLAPHAQDAEAVNLAPNAKAAETVNIAPSDSNIMSDECTEAVPLLPEFNETSSSV